MAALHRITLVIATGNRGKFNEIVALLCGLDVLFLPLDRVGPIAVPPEGGESFQENARTKARAVASASGEWALADDSGLEVDALDGLPGVRSARFAGPRASDDDRNHLLLDKLRGIPLEKRTARFRCALALANPGGVVHATEGVCEGRIALSPRGEGGFGYDPLFEIPRLRQTLAEMAPVVKNQVSHRGQAVTKMRGVLQRLIVTGGR